MSVKLHEAFSMDSFMDRLLFFDDFWGDQLQNEWDAVGTGSAVVVDAQTGGIVRIATGATTNNPYRIDWQDIRSLLVTKKVSVEARVKLNSVSDLDVVLELRFDANNYIDFRFRDTVSANWFIRTMNGGAPTAQDSGIAADTDYHIFRIEAFPTDEVHFYIDGVEVTNSPITTNIPDDAADYLQPYFWLQTKADAIKSMDVDYIYIRQER